MEKSEIYKAIIKIKRHCEDQICCEACEFYDELDGEECLLTGFPCVWETDDINYDVMEGE
ncbi:hypothetical protein [uncultured Anaerovibrio sp.]|uniref:hypothetical protein n=1 Tax=uncultured Anaerovibrio sp. TaxID=361586 RepID=UPI0026053AD8|nr:hypothetical protein [uncultured Anaerovibrio sp.]